LPFISPNEYNPRHDVDWRTDRNRALFIGFEKLKGCECPMSYCDPYAILKDGYTDLRGRFDYVSLNSNELENTRRLAVLVLSDAFGAVVREAPPPKQ
jgi:hypothetical protein